MNKKVKTHIESEGYTLISEYVNSYTKIKMICPNGHLRECRYSSFRDYKCKECVNEEKLEKTIYEIESKGYSILKFPKNSRDFLVATCKNGHTRKTKVHNFLNFGCGECSGKNIKKTIEECRYAFEEKGFTLLEDEYINCKAKMKYLCTCGEERYTTLDTIMNKDNKTSCYSCKWKRVSGELAPTWKGGITPEDRLLRSSKEYNEWRRKVFKRDKYTCIRCKVKGGDLRAHHVLNWSSNIDLRYDVDNGATLCSKCHDVGVKGSFHDIYGVRDNNREQLKEYILENEK